MRNFDYKLFVCSYSFFWFIYMTIYLWQYKRLDDLYNGFYVGGKAKHETKHTAERDANILHHLKSQKQDIIDLCYKFR